MSRNLVKSLNFSTAVIQGEERGFKDNREHVARSNNSILRGIERSY